MKAEYSKTSTESQGDNNIIILFYSRFTRELQFLKKLADYSSKDATNLNGLLQNIGSEFSIYTYGMLNAGVDRESITALKEEQLLKECGIANSIHRVRILETIKGKLTTTIVVSTFLSHS